MPRFKQVIKSQTSQKFNFQFIWILHIYHQLKEKECKEKSNITSGLKEKGKNRRAKGSTDGSGHHSDRSTFQQLAFIQQKPK